MPDTTTSLTVTVHLGDTLLTPASVPVKAGDELRLTFQSTEPPPDHIGGTGGDSTGGNTSTDPTPSPVSTLPTDPWAFLPGETTPKPGYVTDGGGRFFCPQGAPQPFQSAASDPQIPAGTNSNRWALESAMWRVEFIDSEPTETAVSIPGDGFFHITTADLDHQAYSCALLSPKASRAVDPTTPASPAVFDLSGGKVLHASFMAPRGLTDGRWYDVVVAPADDSLTDNGVDKGRTLTLSGSFAYFSWRHDQALFKVGRPSEKPIPLDSGYSAHHVTVTDKAWMTGGWTPGLRRDDYQFARAGKGLNGTAVNAGEPHRFDVWLSQDRALITEQGIVLGDFRMAASEGPDFTRCRVWFLQQLYHTALRPPATPDTRLWSKMGVRVEEGFSVL